MTNSTENQVLDTTPNETVEEIVAQVGIALLDLDTKLTVKDLAAKLNEIITALNTEPGTKPRDRGPESTRVMTEDDARRVMLGDLKDASHKTAAAELGLSYGQIYSARGGYTFKVVHQEKRKQEAAQAEATKG